MDKEIARIERAIVNIDWWRHRAPLSMQSLIKAKREQLLYNLANARDDGSVIRVCHWA
jgi:hypothetical protein